MSELGKGKVFLTLLGLLLFGMAIPSLIVTGVLLLLSIDVSFWVVYGMSTALFAVASAPFLYTTFRKDSDMEDEDDDGDEDDEGDENDDSVGRKIVNDDECSKYM